MGLRGFVLRAALERLNRIKCPGERKHKDCLRMTMAHEKVLVKPFGCF